MILIYSIQAGPSAPGCCCPPRLGLGHLGHVLPAVGGPGQNMELNMIFCLDLSPVQLRWNLLLYFHFGSELSCYHPLT